jgi:hypothetical protein
MVSRFIADIPQEILELNVSMNMDRGFQDDDLML